MQILNNNENASISGQSSVEKQNNNDDNDDDDDDDDDGVRVEVMQFTGAEESFFNKTMKPSGNALARAFSNGSPIHCGPE